MIRTLLARNLRHHARLLTALVGGFLLLEATICWIASQFETGPGIAELMQQFMPPAFQRLFAAQIGAASFDGMVAFGYEHPAILTAAVALVIVVGTLPAGERESGFLDLMLARPVRRTQYMGAVVLTLAFGALILPGALLAGTALGLSLIEVENALPWRRYIPAAASLATLLLGIGGYSLLLGVTSRRRGPAVARAAGLTIALFFLDFLASLWEPIGPLVRFTPFHYHKPINAALFEQTPWVHPVALLSLFALCGAVAFWRFGRQDIRCGKVGPMSVTHRRMALLVAAVLVYAASVRAADDIGRTHEIGKGLYSFTLGEGNYSMFLIGDAGVAVFETFSSRHSEAMLAAIRALTDKPVRYAFHSHNHWDHSSGGQVFKDAGARTVMHELAAQWLAAHPGRDSAPPDLVWSGEGHEVEIGDLTVRLHYLGLNHGLGMTVFTVPELRAAFFADLVNPNRVMFAVVPDFNIGEWERTLTEILEMEFEVAVCSHNELPTDQALKGCTRAHVVEERQFIRDLRAAIIEEFQKGTGFLQVPKAVKLPQYEHWVGYEDWLEMNTLRLMTDLWMGPFPWSPEVE